MNEFETSLNCVALLPLTGAPSELPCSLAAFLNVVESSVAAIPTAWVTAEVAGVSRKGSVLYFELAERDERGEREGLRETAAERAAYLASTSLVCGPRWNYKMDFS